MPRRNSGDGKRPVRRSSAGRSRRAAPRSSRGDRASTSHRASSRGTSGRGTSEGRSAAGRRAAPRVARRRSKLNRDVVHPKLPIFRYIGAALVIIGAFLPWISIGVFTIAGFVFWHGKVAGAAAGLAILTTAIMHGSPRRDAIKTARTFAVAAGVVALFLCLYALKQVTDAGSLAAIRFAEHSDGELSPLGIDRDSGAWGLVGIGLYISLAGCAMLTLAALVEPVIRKTDSHDRRDRSRDDYDDYDDE